MLDCLEKANNTPYHLAPSLSFNNGSTVSTFDVEKGKYLLQMSGFVNSPQGYGTNENLAFNLILPDETKIELPSWRPYISSSYSYPYSLSEVVEIKKGG